MSIEKKSLISNRTASKKAIVTKPEVNKAVTTRLGKLAPISAAKAPRRSVGRTNLHIS